VAAKLFEDEKVPTVGVPKTMDNDVSETDYTFGYDTSVTIAVEALERLRDTARSHSRCIVFEVMGRHAGWVALATGIAGAADYILIPEIPKIPKGASKTAANKARQAELDRMITHIEHLRKRHQKYALVVVSEGFLLPEPEGAGEGPARVDAFGHELLKQRGVGEQIAAFIEDRTGIETRAVAIGHIQRGGPPTTFDRILSTRLGVKAADMVHEGQWGKMAALRGDRIVAADIRKAVAKSKTVPDEWYELARVFWK
jgi:6-phosphofructokinase 1